MNHKQRITLSFLVAALLLTFCAAASALTNWGSNYYFQYSDNSLLSLSAGTTATYEESANNGTNVQFTNLTVNSAPVILSQNISLTALNATIIDCDMTTYVVFQVTGGSGPAILSVPSSPSYVRINNDLRTEGNGWTYASGYVTIIGATQSFALSFTGTPPESVDPPVNVGSMYIALFLFTLIPLVAGGALIVKMLRSEQPNIQEIVIVAVLVIVVTVMVVIATLIIYNVAAFL
jgi:hypothetical protein